MKNSEVIQFSNGLMNLRKELTGRSFNHAVILNRKKIVPFVESLKEGIKPFKEMQEYLDKLEELKLEYVQRNESGNPIIKVQRNPITKEEVPFYDIPENYDPNSEFAKKRTKLYEEYKEHIDKQTKIEIEWEEEVLDEKSEFKPTMIDLDKVPDEIYTVEMEDIIYMINE